MRLRALLKDLSATVLVSSAACGADLIALSEADQLGLRRRVILPFDRNRFRATSVTDRPGDWGSVYDRTLDAVEAAGDLVIRLRSDEPYSSANHAILDHAVLLSKERNEPITAVLVWNGVPRETRDLTNDFGAAARRRGLPVAEVLTI